MATTGKLTGLHVTLTLTLLTTLGLIAAVVIINGDKSEALAAKKTSDAELKNAKDSLRERIDEIADLKTRIGYGFDDVGMLDDQDANTVLGAIIADIKNVGGPLAQDTLKATLLKLRAELNTMIQNDEASSTEVTDLNKEKDALLTRYQAQVDAAKNAQDAAESELQEQARTKKQAIDEKREEIATLVDEKRELSTELEEERDAHADNVKILTEKNTQLRTINSGLRLRVADAERHSFEIPDGFVQWVDHRSQLVWINLGANDQLKKGTTFSVYTKDNDGVGRGEEDIKGSIEITRILGSHRAEAKVLEDDNFQPFSAGDPIYTPLWNPGRPETIAVIGPIDLDGDGQSDREEFHRIVQMSGAKITTEVDDEGNLTGDKITMHTKFLVIAEPDDPTTVPPNEREAAETIVGHLKDMREEAQLHAVEIRRLNDFLAHIGYKPTKRLWRPGYTTGWPLKSGPRNSGTTATVNESPSDK